MCFSKGFLLGWAASFDCGTPRATNINYFVMFQVQVLIDKILINKILNYMHIIEKHKVNGVISSV